MSMPPQSELFGEVISSYTRAQAIEDGVLVDVSELAREAGFRFPVAVSVGVFDVLAPWAKTRTGEINEPEPGQALYGLGQSFTGRTWDLLQVLLHEIRRGKGGERVDFAPLFLIPERAPQGHEEPQPFPVAMYALCGPGDQGEPVITVMLPHED